MPRPTPDGGGGPFIGGSSSGQIGLITFAIAIIESVRDTPHNQHVVGVDITYLVALQWSVVRRHAAVLGTQQRREIPPEISVSKSAHGILIELASRYPDDSAAVDHPGISRRVRLTSNGRQVMHSHGLEDASISFQSFLLIWFLCTEGRSVFGAIARDVGEDVIVTGAYNQLVKPLLPHGS